MKTETFFKRPRYLRAIPSLMLLTTAMAWGMSPDADTDEAVQRKPMVMLVQASVLPTPQQEPLLQGSAPVTGERG